MFYYHYVAYPIVGVFFLAIIIWIIVVVVKKPRRPQVTEVSLQRESVAVNANRNNNNRSASNQPNAADHQSAEPREHTNNCIFGDNNQTYWRLNCGGKVCNDCIVNISSSLITSEVIFCPVCTEAVYNFSFINNPPRVDNAEGNQNSQEIDYNLNIQNEQGVDLNTSQVCNICFERKLEKKIDCQSPHPHMLCVQCYDRLINVQNIKLCPFCRTLIKASVCEEQAPVVLSVHQSH